jgi:hypothetical protein
LKESYNCLKCGKFFCDTCTVERDGKLVCVTCYSSDMSRATRKVLDQHLASKGVKLEGPRMVFRGMEIKELSSVRVEKDTWEFKIRYHDKGEKTVNIDRQTFDQLWKKAQKLGHKTERIPFGQRIVM